MPLRKKKPTLGAIAIKKIFELEKTFLDNGNVAFQKGQSFALIKVTVVMPLHKLYKIRHFFIFEKFGRVHNLLVDLLDHFVMFVGVLGVFEDVEELLGQLTFYGGGAEVVHKPPDNFKTLFAYAENGQIGHLQQYLSRKLTIFIKLVHYNLRFKQLHLQANRQPLRTRHKLHDLCAIDLALPVGLTPPVHELPIAAIHYFVEFCLYLSGAFCEFSDVFSEFALREARHPQSLIIREYFFEFDFFVILAFWELLQKHGGICCIL